MQRDEKQLDHLLESVLLRLSDLKISIGGLINRLETDSDAMNWPSFLDTFALTSSHLTALTKLLSKDILLKSRTVLPLKLSQEKDEALSLLTENRVPIFTHDIVPDYLRTKPDPGAESRMLQHEQKANNLLAETAMKQVTQYNKVITHVCEMVNKAREDWENESNARPGPAQICSLTDTHALVAAVGMGKGLKIPMQVPVQGAPGAGMMVPPAAIRPTAPMTSVSPSGVNQLAKAPAGIKTNIKSGTQIHPFGR